MELIWLPLIKCMLILALLWLTWKQFKKGNMQGVLAFTALAIVAAVYSPAKLTTTPYQHIVPERITVEKEIFKDRVEKDLEEYQDRRDGGK